MHTEPSAEGPSAPCPADCWLTIDRDWTITSCGAGAMADVHQSIGTRVWDSFPGAELHFRPIYDAAWRKGMSSGLIHWNGVLAELHVWVRDDQLHVSYRALTIAGLREILESLVAATEARDTRQTIAAPPEQSASPLRLVAD